MVGGYLGLGIDEYGNFLNGDVVNASGVVTYGGGADNTSSGKGDQTPNAVGLRGAGSTAWSSSEHERGDRRVLPGDADRRSRRSTASRGAAGLRDGICVGLSHGVGHGRWHRHQRHRQPLQRDPDDHGQVAELCRRFRTPPRFCRAQYRERGGAVSRLRHPVDHRRQLRHAHQLQLDHHQGRAVEPLVQLQRRQLSSPSSPGRASWPPMARCRPMSASASPDRPADRGTFTRSCAFRRSRRTRHRARPA